MDTLEITDYYWQCCRDAHQSKHKYAIGRQALLSQASLVLSLFLLRCCFYSDALIPQFYLDTGILVPYYMCYLTHIPSI